MVILLHPRACAPDTNAKNFKMLVEGFLKIRFMHSVYPPDVNKQNIILRFHTFSPDGHALRPEFLTKLSKAKFFFFLSFSQMFSLELVNVINIITKMTFTQNKNQKMHDRC